MLSVYITDLAAYNKGLLLGRWVTLPTHDLSKEIDAILRDGSEVCCDELGYYEHHEEYFITDYEWSDIGLCEVGEHEDIYILNDVLNIISKTSCTDIRSQKIMKFLLDNHYANDLADAICKLDSVLIYEDMTLVDVASSFVEDIYDLNKLPSIIANNIDYESIARDLSYEGRYYEVDNDVFEYVG